MRFPSFYAGAWRVLFLAAGLLFGGLLRAGSDAPYPSGAELIADVLSQFPLEPVELRGDILCRKRHGIPLKELKFEARMRLGDENPSVLYRIMDAFGRHLETLAVAPDPEKGCSYSYKKGNPEAEAAIPNLFEPIQGTDVTWADLSLGFLRWTNAIVSGREEVRGRPCFVVRLTPPSSAAGSGASIAGSTPYAAARVWIDEKLHFMLQAQGLDESDRVIRTLWVRSVKKMGSRWMIKDIEVQADPSRRTKLTVREINGVETATPGAWEDLSSETEILRPEAVAE